ncbi:MAG: hypothetical protein P4K83_08510 [Terracidiphilus sp.]|nr:hypothetical protein [Terracidiphilus sp.]
MADAEDARAKRRLQQKTSAAGTTRCSRRKDSEELQRAGKDTDGEAAKAAVVQKAECNPEKRNPGKRMRSRMDKEIRQPRTNRNPQPE